MRFHRSAQRPSVSIVSSIRDSKLNPSGTSNRLFFQIECPERSFTILSFHFETVTWVKFTRRGILLSGKKPPREARSTPVDRALGEIRQKSGLYRSADDSATQEKSVDLAG